MRHIFSAAVLGAALAAATAAAASGDYDTYREEDDTAIAAYACTKDRHMVEGMFRLVPSHADMVRLNRERPDDIMKQSVMRAWAFIAASLKREEMEEPEYAKLSRRVMEQNVDTLEQEFKIRSGGISLYVYQIETRFLYERDQVPAPGCG